MGEGNHRSNAPSRLGMRGGVGEIVEVQGGHIVRSTGRKDRHSKVCTARGPRDRRVRLSAHTAIQFYDVQDRLGYDRPSKAVDWLIKKAKPAIDKLAEQPTNSANHTIPHQLINEENGSPTGVELTAYAPRPALVVEDERVRDRQQTGGNPNNSSFLPPSLDSDSIADTIRTFFPMGAGASAEAPSPAMHFQNYPPDLLSRTSSQNQDLRLSLQSLQDPQVLLRHHQASNQSEAHQSEHLFPGTGTTSLGGFDGWSEHHSHNPMSRFQRTIPWNANGVDSGTVGVGIHGGVVFNLPPTPSLLQPFFGDNQLFSQRGPLQSSNPPSIRAWMDPSIAANDHQHHHFPPTINQSSFSNFGFTSGGVSGFHIPTRIQGEEEHDGISDKPSSASSDSRH